MSVAKKEDGVWEETHDYEGILSQARQMFEAIPDVHLWRILTENGMDLEKSIEPLAILAIQLSDHQDALKRVFSFGVFFTIPPNLYLQQPSAGSEDYIELAKILSESFPGITSDEIVPILKRCGGDVDQTCSDLEKLQKSLVSLYSGSHHHVLIFYLAGREKQDTFDRAYQGFFVRFGRICGVDNATGDARRHLRCLLRPSCM